MPDIVYYTDPPDTTDYGISFRELPARSGKFAAGGTTSYSRTWEAFTPIIPGTPDEAEHLGPVAVGILFKQLGVYPGALYQLPYSGEKDPVARCSDVTVTQASQNVYQVVAEYSTGSWAANENPLLVAPEYSWSTVDIEVPLWMDFDPSTPKPITNSAGDLFEDPVMTPYSRSVLTIVWNQATYSEAYASTVRNKVNSDTWNGFAPITVLMKSLTAVHVQGTSIAGGYWVVTYVFEFDTVLTYMCRRADAGWQMLDGSSKVKIYDTQGNEPAQIPLLDGTGAELTPGADVEVLEFYQYEQIAFNTEFPITL